MAHEVLWMNVQCHILSVVGPPGVIRSVREGSVSHLALSQRYRRGLWMNTSLFIFIYYYFLNQVTFSFFIYLASFLKQTDFPLQKKGRRRRRRRRIVVSEGGWRPKWVECLFVKHPWPRPRDNGVGWETTSLLAGSIHYITKGGGEGNITRGPGMDVNSSATYRADKDNRPGLGRRP